MSTRCQIGVYENDEKKFREFEALIYKHSDGYPSATLPLLIEFVERFLKGRGYDTEYLSARLVQHLTNESDRDREDYAKQKGYDCSAFTFTGYGICKDFHGDIEFFYAIYPDRIETFEVPFDWCGGKGKKLLSTTRFER